jgi:hypothetical protein
MMISELGQVVDWEYRIWCAKLKAGRLALQKQGTSAKLIVSS